MRGEVCLNSREKRITDFIAAKTLAEAKTISKKLKESTNLPVDIRNDVAKTYYVNSLRKKFTKLYSEGDAASATNIIMTFLKVIGEWVTSLFGALGSLFKWLASGITKIAEYFFTVGTDTTVTKQVVDNGVTNAFGLFGDRFKTVTEVVPSKLKSVLGQIGGIDITVGQAIGIAAILGVCIWGIYKLYKWYKNKRQMSESFVPMFNESDNSLLVLLNKSSRLNEGFFGDGVNKLAMFCIKKGTEAYKALGTAKNDLVRVASPKADSFMKIITPYFVKFSRTKPVRAVMSGTKMSAEWLSKKISNIEKKANTSGFNPAIATSKAAMALSRMR